MRRFGVVFMVAAAAGCGPGVPPGDGSGTGTDGSSEGGTTGATSAGPTSSTTSSAATTTSAVDDTSGESTEDMPSPSLCFEGWTYQEIPGDEHDLRLDLDGDGLDELWRARGRSVDAHAFSDGEAIAELSQSFDLGFAANLADVDGDGRKDLLVLEYGDGMTLVGAEYRAIEPDGGLADVGAPIEYDGPWSGWFFDLDADGDEDVFTFDNDAASLAVSRNDATTFVRQPDVDLSERIMGNNWLTNVMVYDGGRLVLEFVGGNDSIGDQLVAWHADTGQLETIGTPGDGRRLVAIEDLDDDGDRDIIALEYDGVASQLVLHRQQGGELSRERLTEREVYSAALGDFEDRGALQLLLLTADAQLLLLRLDTEEEVVVAVDDTVFSRVHGAANYEPGPGDEIQIELCEFTCVAGYGRLRPC